MRNRSTYQKSFDAIETLESRIAPATFTVLNLHDSGAGSLREAIEGAAGANAHSGADKIVCAPGLAGKITLSSEISITDDLVVKGNGAVKISGNNSVRLFNVDDGTGNEINAKFQNLTMQDGEAAGGGAIYSSENLTIQHCIFKNNETISGDGGAVYQYESDAVVLVKDSVFAGNKSAEYSGAMDCTANSLVISNSLFKNNTAGTGNGGATWLSAETVSISGSTFVGNKTTNGEGGAIKLSSVTSAVIKNSTIAGNSTVAPGENGGGIIIDSGLLTLKGTHVTNNSATGDGGGIYAEFGVDVVVLRSAVQGNSAAGDGGGIAVHGDLSVVSSKVVGNSAGGDGGGIQCDELTDVSLLLSNNLISKNSAIQNGGGVNLLNSGDQMISECSILGNTAGGSGGGMFADNGNLLVVDTVISGNTATDGGGAVVRNSDATFSYSIVLHNTAANDGGGIQAPNLNTVMLQLTPVFGNSALTNSNTSGTFIVV